MIPPIKNFSLGTRIMVMFGFLMFNYLLFPSVASLVVGQFYGMDKIIDVLSGNMHGDSEKYVFLFVQGVGSLGAFAFTSLLVSQMETGFVLKRLGLNIRPALKFFVMGVFAVLVAQVFTQFLVEVNQQIPLPKALKFLEEQEAQAEKITNTVLAGNGWMMFMANVLVLAVIPAIGEELFFRGLLLGDLLKSKVNPAFAIIGTGLLFSISHFEFGNMLAIWALGSFLGYLYYTSGSLWLSMAAHFTNNFLVILFKYLYNSGYIKSDIAEATFPLYAVVISAAVFMLCLFVINKWRRPVDFSIQLSAPVLDEEEGYGLNNEE
jgi:hypothetical protein